MFLNKKQGIETVKEPYKAIKGGKFI